MTQTTTKKQPFIQRLLGSVGRVEQLEAERARLEAFLSAFPGDYCGLSKEGLTVYSPDFCTTLGVQTVETLSDIANALSPSDSAALEGMAERLQSHGTAFVLNAKTSDETKTLKISGARGQNTTATDQFLVLWIEDITAQHQASQTYAQAKEQTENEFTQIRTALDSIPRPVWLRDTQQNLVWVNSTYGQYLNMDRADIIGQQKEITSSTPKKKNANDSGLEPGKPLAKKAIDSGEVTEIPAHGIFHGKRLLLKLSEIPLGGLGMTLGIAYNITKEEELETQLDRFQSSTNELLEHMRSAIAVFDVDKKLSFYNSAYGQLCGLDASWLDRKPKLSELMEKLRENRRLPEQADFKSYKQTWLDMFTNLIKPREDMLHLPDGTALRMLVVPHSAGGLMMTFEDVTSRLELESSYNTLIAVQKETLDNLAEGVAVYGSDGRLKLWNPAFKVTWGLERSDVTGTPHIKDLTKKKAAFFPVADWPKYEQELAGYGLDRKLTETRLQRTPQNGDKQTLLDIITVPLPDGGVLITYSDVTSTVEVENALREKAKALETAEQLKTDFLANVSYQLRTPLSAIMGFADILKNEYFGKLNDRQKEYTTDIQTASTKLLDLINDILDLSTLEAGYLTLERTDFKISDMLDRVSELVSDWGRKEKVEITINAPDNIGSLNADERRIQQAIINVIRNAITYTQEDGTIQITAARTHSEIHFIIEDSGIGISQEDKIRIFKPFERAGTGASNNKYGLMRSGTGIGLSLVNSITGAHGGRVSLESEEGKGTKVTLIIPLSSTKTSFKVPEKS